MTTNDIPPCPNSFSFLLKEVQEGRLVFGSIFTQHGVAGSALASVLRKQSDIIVNEIDGVMCRPGPSGSLGTIDDMYDRLKEIYLTHLDANPTVTPIKMVVKFMGTSWPPTETAAKIFKLGTPLFMTQHPALCIGTYLQRSCVYFQKSFEKNFMNPEAGDMDQIKIALNLGRYDHLSEDLLHGNTSYYRDRFNPFLDFVNRGAPGLAGILGFVIGENILENGNNRDFAVEFNSVYRFMKEYADLNPKNPVHVLDGTAFQSRPDFYIDQIVNKIWSFPPKPAEHDGSETVINDFDDIKEGPRALLSEIMFGDTFKKGLVIHPPHENPLPPKFFPEAYREILGDLVIKYYATLADTMRPSSILPYPKESELPDDVSPLARFNCRLLNNPDGNISSFLSHVFQTLTSPLDLAYIGWALKGVAHVVTRRSEPLDHYLRDNTP